jgi:microcystin-dependent protein
MSSPFVAEIRMMAFNFAPKGWAFCAGQLLPISQNTALFSLLGTYYGGDGKSTFALPNLQGNAPLNQGQSTTGTDYFLGQESGVSNVTLIQSEMPPPTHNFLCRNNDADTNGNGATPTHQFLAKGGYDDGSNAGVVADYTTTAANCIMNPLANSLTGSSFPHNNMMPYLVLNFCIALQGIFPPRG